MKTTRYSLSGSLRWLALLLIVICAISQAQPGPATGTASELPAHWRPSYRSEPVLGSTIRVVTVGESHKPTLLLVHGLGDKGLLDWEEVIEHLRRDFQILALDLPGFGHSNVPDEGRLSPESYAAVLNWLVADEQLDSFHLAGHSLGGAVALYYAARYPQELQSLTLIDAAGVLHRSAFVKSFIAIEPRDYDFLPGFLRRPAARLANFGEDLMERINLLPDPTGPLQSSDLAWDYLLGDRPSAAAAIALVNTDYSPLLPAVEAPTRIIWGAEDAVTPLRTAHVLNAELENSHLSVIEAAGHVPISSHSEEVAQFIRSHALARPAAPAKPEPQMTGREWPDLECRDQVGKRISGRYGRITLDNCLDVHLEDVQATSIQMQASEATLLRVQLRSEDTALRLEQSSARITDALLQAPRALQLNAARADLAAVTLEATETAIDIGERSVVIASVSEVDSPHYRGKLHGLVRASRVRGENLSQLRSAPDLRAAER